MASVLKRRILICSIFEEMIPEIDGDDEAGFEEVILHLPKKLQAFFNLLRIIKDRLKRAFAVFKHMRSREAQTCYLFSPQAQRPNASRRETASGLMRAFTTTFDIPSRSLSFSQKML